MDSEYNLEDEILDDVEICEDEPDFDQPQSGKDGAQDDAVAMPLGFGFMARVTSAIRTWKEALFWYRGNQNTSQIGFDPDGMCLKVCRTARNIPAKYLTAKEAQDATPTSKRVTNVRDLRTGMILFFDDPRDSNRSGHIVTLVGRARGVNPDSLDSLLTETNSVKMDELVVVRGSYFTKHWGDSFKFGAAHLNGVDFDVAGGESRIERFNDGGPVYNLNVLHGAAKNGREQAGRVLANIETQIKRLPDHPDFTRVREFKSEWNTTRKIDMSLLDEAVKLRPKGLIQKVRDEIRRLIETLPDE